ncbi:MAG TPA: peptide deformylase [Candidatus Paceibacterota bacterium]|nr:peptide deformylase [Candidatus Paceibacterota bacterium]
MEILIGENNKTLRQRSLPVRRIDADARSLIEQMRKVMKQNNGVGLAAIQIGEPTRIIVCEIDDKFYTFINPEIIKSFSETSVTEEGCLSLPNMYGEVERPKKISLKAINFDGKKIKIKAFGLLARVVQHEIDHLDGILFIDKAKNITKQTRKTTAL